MPFLKYFLSELFWSDIKFYISKAKLFIHKQNYVKSLPQLAACPEVILLYALMRARTICAVCSRIGTLLRA